MKSTSLAKLVGSLLLLTHSGLVFGWDIKDIVNAVTDIKKTTCRKITSENEEQCEELDGKLKLLKSREQQDILKVLQSNYGRIPCRDREEELERVRNVVTNWITASRSTHIYDPLSVLNAIFCIEKGRPTWEQECLKDQKDVYKVTWPDPLDQCTVTVPAPKTEDKVKLDDIVWHVDVTLQNKCKDVLLHIFQGEGAYKKAIRQYDYQSWKDMIYLRWKKIDPTLSAAKKAEIEADIRRELLFAKRIQNHHYVGVPEYQVKFEPNSPIEGAVMWVEAFEEELGQNEKPLAPMSVGGWQQATSQLNAGLVFLHDMGYLHSDIKPPNILISHRNDPKNPPKAVYADFGLSLDLKALCEKNLGNMPARLAAGTPLNMAPEQLVKGFQWEGRDCQEVLKHAQSSEVFSHAQTIYRLKHGGEVLPWMPEDKEYDNRSMLSNTIKTDIHKIMEKLRLGDATDRLLAEALNINLSLRPGSREFQERFDRITKEGLQNSLKKSVPDLRIDIDSNNVRQALVTGNSRNYIAYVETSPDTGLFEIKLAYLDQQNSLVTTPLSANPFEPKEVTAKIKEFNKRTKLKLFAG